MRVAFLTIPAFLAGVAGCANQPQQSVTAKPIPTYITAQRSCAIMEAGVGSHFADPKVTGFWHAMNVEIATRLQEMLTKDGYRTVKLEIPVTNPPANAPAMTVKAMAQHQCNRIIQVGHDVGEDGKGRYFKFSVVVMHIEPRKEGTVSPNGTNVTTLGDFDREYRYPRTPEAMGAFNAGTLATSMFVDLVASGSLAAIRQDR